MKYNISIRASFKDNKINVVATELNNQKIFDTDSKSSVAFEIDYDSSVTKDKSDYIDQIIGYLYNSILVKNKLDFESLVEYDSESKSILNPEKPLVNITSSVNKKVFKKAKHEN